MSIDGRSARIWHDLGCSLAASTLLSLLLAAPALPVQAQSKVPFQPATVAQQPQVRTTHVPRIVGLSEATAIARLQAAHLSARNAGTDPSPQNVGTVLSSDPTAGTEVGVDSVVAYRIASGTNLVPSVIGKTQQQAQSILEAAGFRLGDVQTVKDESTPGEVLNQSPKADTLARLGGEVALTLAVRQDPVLVPDVTGKTEDEAFSALARHRLNASRLSTESSSFPTGRVSRTRPGAGTAVPAYSTVGYWLSASKHIVVPNVIGWDEAHATARLKQAGLSPQRGSEAVVGEASGPVSRTDPRPGTVLTPGDMVSYWLQGRDVIVPDIVGRDEDSAQQVLRANELRPQRRSEVLSSKPKDTVLSSDPRSGTHTASNSTVIYWIASGKNAVPDVRAASLATAAARLKVAGFRVGTLSRHIDPGQPDRVAAQTPAAGASAELGEPVALTLTVPIRVRVPDLRGLPQHDAQRGLIASGLVIGSTESRRDFAASGTVIGQRPAPGLEVDRGTPVSLSISKGWLPLATQAAVVLMFGGFVAWQVFQPASPPVTFVGMPPTIATPTPPDVSFQHRDLDIRLHALCGEVSVSPPDSVEILESRMIKHGDAS